MTNTKANFLLGALRWQSDRRTASKFREIWRQGRLQTVPKLTGIPHLEIEGSVRIGRNLEIISVPIQSHLVVYRTGHLEIGDDVKIGFGSGLSCHSHVSVGAQTVLGNYVSIIDSDYHVAGNSAAEAEASPIWIGDNVTIGDRVTVLRGSRIEDGAVVGSDSVVSGLIPSGANVAGVPARQIGQTFSAVSATRVSTTVLLTAQRTFRLRDIPKVSDGPSNIERWDSLGGLSFHLEIESELGIVLNVDAAAKVATLAELIQLVEQSFKP